jgi:hypothetical protein
MKLLRPNATRPAAVVARRAVCSDDRAGISGSMGAVDQVLLMRLTIAFIFARRGDGTLV